MSNIKSKDTYKRYQRKKKKTEREALKLWKSIVLERFPLCVACKERRSVDPHHYYYKSSYGFLKFDLDNGVGLCGTCHSALHFGGDPKKKTDKIDKNMPKGWKQKLKKKSQNAPQGTYKNLTWLEAQYKKLFAYRKL